MANRARKTLKQLGELDKEKYIPIYNFKNDKIGMVRGGF